MGATIQEHFHAIDPYDGFDAAGQPEDLQGWDGEDEIFWQIIRDVRPQRIVEVGTWKGRSAITMAKHVSDLNLKCEIVCVDTWLGSRDAWNKEDKLRYGSLRLKNGYPQLYYTFLGNVVRAGYQDMITPMPMPSMIAASLLKRRGVTADITYIDASHDTDDVRQDCMSWEPVTTQLMFGHDADSKRVMTGVSDFRKQLKRLRRPHSFQCKDQWWQIDFRS